MLTLAERLKNEREAQGLTQDALAKKVDKRKRQSLISNIEKGTYKSSPYLPEIAYALGLQAMWLKTGLGPKTIYPETTGGTVLHARESDPLPAHEADLLNDFRLLLDEDQGRIHAEVKKLADIARAYRTKFGEKIADNGRVAACLPPAMTEERARALLADPRVQQLLRDIEKK